MAKPRGGDWLQDEIESLRRSGIDIVVSALTPAEVQESGLDDEAELAANAGLRFVSIPITDRSVPELDHVEPTLRFLSEELASGSRIAVHCRFGIGRSSLVAAALLVMTGLDAELAWSRIGRARGVEVPDTAAQRRWTDQLRT